MGEQRAVRIRSCLCSVFVHFRCCKYIAISICNISSDNALCKRILPLIIRTIDKRLGFYSCEINEVPHQCNKQDHKEICNFSEIFILCAFPFFPRPLSWDFFEFRSAFCRLSGRCSSHAIFSFPFFS